MKTIEMEITLANYFGCYRKNLVIPNVKYGMQFDNEGLHECDILVCTESNFLWECEIKISKSDLIADKKKSHGHFNKNIKRLYFAIPRELFESCKKHIPERAGILTLQYIEGILHVTKKRNPIGQKGKKISKAEKFRLAHLGAMRIWTLKKRILKCK